MRRASTTGYPEMNSGGRQKKLILPTLFYKAETLEKNIQ